jgi:Fe-S-cluster containining protein
MDFPCIKCGLCCRTLKFIPALADYDNGDGVCRHLKNDLCEIYEKRPVICNIERMYFLYFADNYNLEQFILENLVSCIKLAENSGNINVYKKLNDILKEFTSCGQSL